MGLTSQAACASLPHGRLHASACRRLRLRGCQFSTTSHCQNLGVCNKDTKVTSTKDQFACIRLPPLFLAQLPVYHHLVSQKCCRHDTSAFSYDLNPKLW